MSTPGESALSEALDRLWKQYLPQMLDRVGIIDAAVTALTAGSLNLDQRIAASSAAHKLAGVLGTFGLANGTMLAREAEMLFSHESECNEQTLPRLREIATELRKIIASRA